MKRSSPHVLIIACISCLMFGQSFATALAQTPAATPVAENADQWIVYQHDERIKLVRHDGSEDHVLTPDWTGGPQFHPDWSPDGNRIAFSADHEDGTRDIWIVSLDGMDAELVYDCVAPCIAADDPAWSPDGSKLAVGVFSDVEGFTSGTVEVVDLATESVTIVHKAEKGLTTFVPRWSPDGSRIVFDVTQWDTLFPDSETAIGNSIQVVTVGSEPAPATVLMDFDTNSGYPDWHPTEDLIVFQTGATTDGPFDLATIRPDGTGLTPLTALAGSGFQAIQPTWSPDGASVTFVYDEMWTNARLGEVLADGTLISAGPDGMPPMTHPRLQPEH